LLKDLVSPLSLRTIIKLWYNLQFAVNSFLKDSNFCLYLGGLRIFIFFGFWVFLLRCFVLESARIEEKQLIAEMEQFVLGCFFGLGFDLFAG